MLFRSDVDGKNVVKYNKSEALKYLLSPEGDYHREIRSADGTVIERIRDWLVLTQDVKSKTHPHKTVMTKIQHLALPYGDHKVNQIYVEGQLGRETHLTRSPFLRTNRVMEYSSYNFDFLHKRTYWEMKNPDRTLAKKGIKAKLEKFALAIANDSNGCERPVLRRLGGFLFNIAGKIK